MISSMDGEPDGRDSSRNADCFSFGCRFWIYCSLFLCGLLDSSIALGISVYIVEHLATVAEECMFLSCFSLCFSCGLF